MLRSRAIGFFWRFALLYVLVVFQWPGFDQMYGDCFRSLCTSVFSNDSGSRMISFTPHEVHHGYSTLGTRITLANRDLADSQGNSSAQLLDLDTRSVGWVPTGLTAALILATPIPWRRRIGALASGLVLVQAFILLSVQSWIWQASPAVSLGALSPFWKARTDDLEYILITQLGASFSVPLVIWIIVTFRRRDEELWGLKAAKS